MSVNNEIILTIFGRASNKNIALLKIKQSYLDHHKSQSLMDFLIAHGIRIASSCSGEGVCKKCVVNDQIISCQITLDEYLKEKRNDNIITINYL